MKYIKAYEKQQKDKDFELFGAVRAADIVSLKRLLRADANPNIMNIIGRTPMSASISGTGRQKQIIKIINYLIQYGADINLGKSIIRAAQSSKYQVLEHLIELGANWNIKDDQNMTFLDYLDSKYINLLIKKYPKQYKEYQFKIDVDKYNI